MSSLEFINQEIEFLEDMISMDLSLVEDDFDLQEIHKKQQRLRHLKQIKSEVEAWKVVSNPHNIIEFGGGILEIWYDTQKEENILKKALEVEENEKSNIN